MGDKLKVAGLIALALPFAAGVALVGVLFVYGGVLAAGVVQPWLLNLSGSTAMAVLLVFLPLALWRATRGVAAAACRVGSYVFGCTVLAWAVLFAFQAWGLGAVVAGLLMMGIGVVPVAMAAAAWKGAWPTLAALALLTALAVAARFGAALLSRRSGRR